MTKLYIETERQGPGRRYWFRRVAARKAFQHLKEMQGYAVTGWGRTAWVSYSRAARRSARVRAVLAGIDPWSMQ